MAAKQSRRSLWAMPSARDAEPFTDCIERLAVVAAAPTFAPHVTLLGSVPDGTDDAIGPALAEFEPFSVTLTELADSDERFRCITVVTAPDPPLLALRAALTEACGVDPTPFEPHLSVLYAELPRDPRKALRDSVEIALPRFIEINTVCLADTSDDIATRWWVDRSWSL